MNRIKVFSIFIATLLSGCKKQRDNFNPLYIPSDEAEITTLVFDRMVSSDSAFRLSVLKDYDFDRNDPSTRDNSFFKELKHERDSIKVLLDTAKVYVLIDDKMLKIYPGYLSETVNLLKKEDRANHLPTVSSWQREIKIDSNQNQIFILKNLAFHNHYQYLLKSHKNERKQNSLYVGMFKMSSVFFNKQKNKAFVHTLFICGGLCGTERDFYLLKKDGKWTIVLNDVGAIA